MAKKRIASPGDTLHLTVPANRHLQAGVYAAKVLRSLDSKVHSRQREERYACSVVVGEDVNGEDLLVFFQVALPKHDRFHGYAFLGDDQFPVECSHEQDLATRLKASIPKHTPKDWD